MAVLRSLDDITGFAAPDGSFVRELGGRSTGLTSHSLAVICHPAGTQTIEHHHAAADEIYFVQSGRGRVRLAGETHEVGPGDSIIIRPGQSHKLWCDGPGDLVLIVSCAPAYSADEVAWDE